jgi:predicted nucleic acid-binding Zn ribbon protein
MESVIINTDKRLNAHEQVCAERYKGILESFEKGSKRMQRIEYLLYFVIVSVFFNKDVLTDTVKTLLIK